MKIFIGNSVGNLFFMNEGILMAVPLPREDLDATIDLDEESCEVENEENPELLQKIRSELGE